MTKIYLIRHGESLGNATRLYLGHTNLDLSEKGKMQADAAAEYFKNFEISAIYSSDLLRAHNTALPHARLHGLSVNDSVNLREIYLGDWEGMPIDELKEKWENEFVGIWYGKFGSCLPPNGELVYNAGKRLHDELLRIARENDGTILITSHAAAIRAFWCYFQGIEPDLWAQFVSFPTNASATFVGFDGEKFYPIKYSFDDYLKESAEKKNNEA